MIVPGEVDIDFLLKFVKIVEKFIKKNYRFVIVCGGGSIARKYQVALRKSIGNNQKALDWIGIEATILNAALLKLLFRHHSEKFIVSNPTTKIISSKKIIIASGWKPGWSTDYDAVLLAKQFKADKVINMSNVDYVYDKDPRKNKSAKRIKNVCWSHYRKIIGSKWKAGLNAPFDPVAAKEAEKLKLNVFIIGKNLKNFENLVNGKKFRGTFISYC